MATDSRTKRFAHMKRIVVVLSIVGALVFPSGVTGASATPGPSVKQKTTHVVIGDCEVLSVIRLIVITENVTTECFIGVDVVPIKPGRKVILQHWLGGSAWGMHDETRTNSKGKAGLYFNAWDSRECFFDTTFTYRIKVPAKGSNKPYTSDSFNVLFEPNKTSAHWIANCA